MTLLLGPLLRRVVGDRATVWVETSAPATVMVRAGTGGGAARTFTAFGRHYALVVVDGLPAAAATPYQVLLDGAQVWPPPGYDRPVPVIRTRDDTAPVRLVFGSCREASPRAVRELPPDALDSYSARLAGTGRDWPDLLLLLGDQVYADETSRATRRWLRRPGSPGPAPAERAPRAQPDTERPAGQVVDFTGYARLYHESWTDPDVRWLLSTVPSSMIFDDHEIIDDWNTSQRWRERMVAQPWWRERITAGLASYWVYQHLGNLDPDELGADPVYPAVVSAADATGILREFGAAADDDRSRYRWSYALDVGRSRIVVLDNRCGRQVTPGQRAMLPDAQWEWLVRTVRGDGYDHLVLGSSLPWLMPFAVHHLEEAVSALAESPRRPVAAAAESLRQVFDLEHWPAFGHSFDALTALLGQLATGAAGTAGAVPAVPAVPASISVLSGDVHHSYVARADLAGAPIHQVTCSPVHNRVPLAMRAVFRAAWTGRVSRAGRALGRAARVRPAPLTWTKLAGPYFGTAVGTLVHNGRSAHVLIEGTTPAGDLKVVARQVLAASVQ